MSKRATCRFTFLLFANIRFGANQLYDDRSELHPRSSNTGGYEYMEPIIDTIHYRHHG